MQIVLLNGSPRRKGNTRIALNQIISGIQTNIPSSGFEFVDVANLHLMGCTNCEACKTNGGVCIHEDDSADLMEKIAAGDLIIFGTPVYWWGISAQLKLAIDKFHSRTELFQTQHKRVGLVVIGASSVPDFQYQLICEQFECTCEYRGWEIIFEESISAFAEGEVSENAKVMERLGELWTLL